MKNTKPLINQAVSCVKGGSRCGVVQPGETRALFSSRHRDLLIGHYTPPLILQVGVLPSTLYFYILPFV